MAVKKAKYVYYTKGCENALKNGNYGYAQLDEEEIQALQPELAGWYVCDYSTYCIEYDDYDDVSRGSDINYVAVTDMVSCCSGMYSSSDVLGDILIDTDNHFIGVVLKVTQSGGNGWNNYDRTNYAILYTNGKVDGKAEKEYSFSGESSSKEYTNSYSLVKREQN